MLTQNWLDYLPLWAIFVITVLIVLIAIEGGFRLAVLRKQQSGKLVDVPISSVIGGTLGLLAFLLAFTFGMAASRFETRRQLLLDEVNAVGTCYLRAGLVPDSECQQIRKRLREYVHQRVEVVKQPQTISKFLLRSDEILDELWLQRWSWRKMTAAPRCTPCSSIH